MLNRSKPRVEPLEDRRMPALVTVNTLADTVDFTDGLTSLREAIFSVNLVPGADTIRFGAQLTAAGNARIVIGRGELRISDHLTISGPGADLLTIDASGSDPTPDQNNADGSRVFHIDDGDDSTLIGVSFSGLALTGGDALGRGGAILSHENLTLLGSAVIDNSAVSGDISLLSQGGGIAHSGGSLVVLSSTVVNNSGDLGGGIHIEDGTLTVRGSVVAENAGVTGAGVFNAGANASVANSSIRGNSAGAFSLGGGIYNSGNLRIESTTISGNTASFGGGLFSRTDPGGSQATSIINSTISGNTALTRGGGVRNAVGRTLILFSTITNNQAPDGEGGGVASRGYADTNSEIGSTIIAGNANSDVDFGTGALNTFTSLGYNLIGTGSATSEFHATGDQLGITDPRLSPLADNGGLALPMGSQLLTHALFPGSSAIDAGNLDLKNRIDDVPRYDQRGAPFMRIYVERIDIGALEWQPNPLTGDYNFDGVVDAADYVHWRSTLGSTNDLRADGSGEGAVDDGDRMVWAANFGRTRQFAVQPTVDPISALDRHPHDRSRPTPRQEVSMVAVADRRSVVSRLTQAVSFGVDERHNFAQLAMLRLQNSDSDERDGPAPTARSLICDLQIEKPGVNSIALDGVFDRLGTL
jgi:hypothetical protein